MKVKWLRVIALVLLLIFIPQQIFAKSSKVNQADLSSLFKEPSTGDLLLGLGISLGSCLVAGSMGSAMKGTGFGFQQAAVSLGEGMFYSQISQAAMNLGVQQFGMKPGTAQIFGYGVSGAFSGMSNAVNGEGVTFKLGGWFDKHPVFTGAMMGTFQGTAMGGGSLMAYESLKNTSLYQKNPFAGQQLASLIGGAAGYLGFYKGLDIAGSLRGKEIVSYHTLMPNNEKGTIHGVDVTGYAQHSNAMGGSMGRQVPSTAFGSNFKIALYNPSFQTYFISQAVSLGIEYAAGPKNKYARLLAEPLGGITAGAFTKGNFSQAVFNGVISGAASLALGKIGGEYNSITGKNKLGLTPIQMSGLNWLGTSLLKAGYGKLAGARFTPVMKNTIGELGVQISTWGGTSPTYTKGAGGWSQFLYIEKLAQFSGISNFKANADTMMKQLGYNNWNAFVKDGHVDKILPSFSSSLVNYVQSNLHSAAVGNISALIKGKGLFNKSAVDAKRVDANKQPSLQEIAQFADNWLDEPIEVITKPNLTTEPTNIDFGNKLPPGQTILINVLKDIKVDPEEFIPLEQPTIRDLAYLADNWLDEPIEVITKPNPTTEPTNIDFGNKLPPGQTFDISAPKPFLNEFMHNLNPEKFIPLEQLTSQEIGKLVQYWLNPPEVTAKPNPTTEPTNIDFGNKLSLGQDDTYFTQDLSKAEFIPFKQLTIKEIAQLADNYWLDEPTEVLTNPNPKQTFDISALNPFNEFMHNLKPEKFIHLEQLTPQGIDELVNKWSNKPPEVPANPNPKQTIDISALNPFNEFMHNLNPGEHISLEQLTPQGIDELVNKWSNKPPEVPTKPSPEQTIDISGLKYMYNILPKEFIASFIPLVEQPTPQEIDELVQNWLNKPQATISDNNIPPLNLDRSYYNNGFNNDPKDITVEFPTPEDGSEDMYKAIKDFYKRGSKESLEKLKTYDKARTAIENYNPERHYQDVKRFRSDAIDVLVTLADMGNSAAHEFLRNLDVTSILPLDGEVARRSSQLESLAKYNTTALICILNGGCGRLVGKFTLNKLDRKDVREQAAILDGIIKQGDSTVQYIADMADLYAKAKNSLGTNRLFAFYPDTLKILVDDAESPSSDTRPLAIVIGPKGQSDHNKAFSETPFTFLYTPDDSYKQLHENGLKIRYEEIGNEGKKAAQELTEVIPALAGQQTPAIIMLRGHGTPYSIRFGSHSRGAIYFTDVDLLKESGLSKYADSKTQIILDSCSTGACVESGKKNMVDVFRHTFPYAGAVWGPKAASAIGVFQFDPNNHNLTDVVWNRAEAYKN